LSEENGADRPPEEEGREERNRRVRPLFRFGRRSRKDEVVEEEGQEPEQQPQETFGETPGGEPTGDEDDPKGPVRPVRVVKFVPSEAGDGTSGEVPVEGDAPFVEEADAPFVEEAEAPFVEEAEAPFVEEAEAPFVEEADAPFVEEDEATFVEEADAPFDVGPEEPASDGEGAEAPFVFEEQPTPVHVEAPPEGSYADMERTRWEEPVHDSISTQEEAETGEDMELRSEESPSHIEADEGVPRETPEEAAPSGGEPKPHYHKYLKPDEDLISRPQARGPATGFDRDMDADAGEIDFGIDLIDPSERRKRKKTPPKKQEGAGPKKGVGGHDSDGEVDSRGMGGEVGVDYSKRRKRRL
jgi:hypothetical protein